MCIWTCVNFTDNKATFISPELEFFTDEKIYIEYKAALGIGAGVISSVGIIISIYYYLVFALLSPALLIYYYYY